MKKTPWIVSGLGLFFAWPFIGLMTAFAYDEPTVPAYFEIIRILLMVTLVLIPVVWIVALVLAIIETRKRNREKWLKYYALAPYWAAGAHLLVWIAAFAKMDWS